MYFFFSINKTNPCNDYFEIGKKYFSWCLPLFLNYLHFPLVITRECV